jgi:hypothetical protein
MLNNLGLSNVIVVVAFAEDFVVEIVDSVEAATAFAELVVNKF